MEQQERQIGSILAAGKAWIFWTVAFLVWELTLRLYAEQGLAGMGWLILEAVAAAGIVAALTGLPGWGGTLLRWFIPWLAYSLYGVQLVYFDIFGSFLSVGFVSMGGEAIIEFWNIVVESIVHCLPRLLVMAIPPALFVIQRRWELLKVPNWRTQVALLAACVTLTGVVWTGTVFRATAGPLDNWVSQYGLLTAQTLDVRDMLTGGGKPLNVPGGELVEKVYDSEHWNVIDGLDFKVLDEQTKGETLSGLNAYFSRREPTAKNEYTGMFRDYNLIVICAEAFSPYLVDEERTPALYRLSNEGILFRNFYNSFPNLTTNGEYGLCMGLWPDPSCMSFSASATNFYPFCLGTAWKQTGAEVTHAYHNNGGNFYNRINSHTNMGYEFKAVGYGLELEAVVPTSDLEMFQKTVDDYIGEEGFHAYYMTYSGHARYTVGKNAIADRNRPLVEDPELSEALQGYYACQLELEFAMEYLLDRLEEAGIADKTVIVLTGDHMPYGLPEEDYAIMAGDAVSDPFWDYRNSFICWNGGMEEPLVVDDYCCTEDILPTLLNLFGLTYDSRLLTGRDVLADCDHMAVLKDGSFVNDRVRYSNATGELTWYGEPDEEYAQGLIAEVQDQFTVSASMLHLDYYEHVFSTLGLEMVRAEPAEYVGFSDIEGRWYEEDVKTLQMHGVLNVNNSAIFGGENRVSFEELAAMLTRGLRLRGNTDELPPYTNLRHGAWYTDSLCAAYAAGLLPDTEEFPFGRKMLVEEARDMLGKAADYMGIENGALWARKALREALEYQRTEQDVMPGYLSRGAVAHVILQLMELVEQNENGSLAEQNGSGSLME